MTIDERQPKNVTPAVNAQLFESIPDCAIILDADGCISAINRNGLDAMAVDFATVGGRSWKALWPACDDAALEQAMADALQGGVGRFTAVRPTAEAGPVWWDVTVTPIRTDDGRIESIFAVVRDVTAMHAGVAERERLLRALQSANQRVIGIFRQAPALMCVLRGPEHVFELANERYLQFIGNRDVIGQPLQKALPEVVGQGYVDLLDRVYRTGEPFSGVDMPVSLQPSPDAPMVERFIDFVGIPLKDAEDVITGIFIHGVDQTERKNSLTQLFDSRERFQKVVHQAGAGVVETDIDGRIVLVNEKYCAMLGHTEEELLGVSLLDMTAPDSLHATREALQLMARGGPGFVLDKQYRHKDGSFRWSTSSVNPLRDAAGKYHGIVAVVIDITEARRASEALRESEERYRTLFETMDQGFCILDMIFDAGGKPVDYRFAEMNPMFEQHTGLTGATNKTARELVPDMDDLWVDTYGRVALTGEPTRFEHRDAAMNRWFDVHATRIGGVGSNKVALLFRDISARKQADDALRSHAARQTFQLELADRLRPLAVPDQITAAASALLGQHLGISRVAFAEVDDANGSFVIRQDWNNEGIASVAGGVRKLDDFGPDVVADLRAGLIMAVDDVTLDPRTAPFIAAYEMVNIRANAAIPLLKEGRLRAILALHAATPHHWTQQALAFAQDTVERTWAAVDSALSQHALRIQQELSQSVLDSMIEGFALFDRDWTILEFNEVGARLARHARAELIGKNHWQAVPEVKGTQIEAFYRQAQRSGQAATLEYHHTYPSGEKVWVEVRVYPLDEGKLAIFFRDITERKQTEQDLEEAGRRKDEFLAMLAHELRNPLAPIGAAAELLQVGKLDEARVRKSSEVIGRQVRHMTHLIEDLLDVSRVTRGLVELDKSVIEVRHAVNEAVEQVNPLIHARHHQLALHLAPDATMVLGDKKRLVQVVANLLNNAAKYTHQGGQLELRTSIRNAHVVIDVVDSGIGMTPELVSHAFDLFAQAERTSDRSSGGLGLGLALVKSLVELHGGTVTCNSTGLGMGSRFTVSLPLASGSRDDAFHVNGRDDSLALAKPLRIMVVDDNADAAAMLAMLLEATGHEVLIEHGSHRALQRAKLEAPQVCLLDIGLPELDGYELAQRLRAMHETTHAILIAVTGYGQESDRIRAAAAGFDHHLVKPVDTAKLTAILSQASGALAPRNG